MIFETIKEDIKNTFKTSKNCNCIHSPINRLYRNRYIASVYISSPFCKRFHLSDKDSYDDFLKSIKKEWNKKKKNSNNIYRNVFINAALTHDELDTLIENADKESSMHSLIPYKIINKKPPRGSLKYRVKITLYYWHTRESKECRETFLENITSMFGTDTKSDIYCKTIGVARYSFTGTYIYVNFKNEEDAMMLLPFTNDESIQNVVLEVFNG